MRLDQIIIVTNRGAAKERNNPTVERKIHFGLVPELYSFRVLSYGIEKASTFWLL